MGLICLRPFLSTRVSFRLTWKDLSPGKAQTIQPQLCSPFPPALCLQPHCWMQSSHLSSSLACILLHLCVWSFLPLPPLPSASPPSSQGFSSVPFTLWHLFYYQSSSLYFDSVAKAQNWGLTTNRVCGAAFQLMELKILMFYHVWW